jgi:hypothetical protein
MRLLKTITLSLIGVDKDIHLGKFMCMYQNFNEQSREDVVREGNIIKHHFQK